MVQYLVFFIVSVLFSSLAIAGSSIDFSGLHDPTKPFDVKKDVNTKVDIKLQLDMTFVSSKERSAIINGDVYLIGDIVDGYEVIHIQKNEVALKSTFTGEEKVISTDRNLVLERKTRQNR